MVLRDYTFMTTTQSLCPECLALVPAKVIEKQGRIYFRKHCPTHGRRDDYVCSDASFYDRSEYNQPARLPNLFGVEPSRGCPYDCGLCTEHEQHTCIGLVELTSSCNLTCPMCYASSAPGGQHVSVAQCRRAIDRLVEVEGRPEVLQLSGGEPTIHPEFEQIVEYALAQPIDFVQINTNGIRLATDHELVQRLAKHRDRLEIFFQLDGFRDDISLALRGEALTEIKLRALEQLGQADLHVTLAVTLQSGINDDQLGPIVQFAAERPWITGINFQPATYSGRHVLPSTLERRTTFPDVIQGIAEQTNGLIQAEDFIPLPCAHPNCHSLAHLIRNGDSLIPLNRIFDVNNNLDLLANGITFTRERAGQIAQAYLSRQACCGGNCAPAASTSMPLHSNGNETSPVNSPATISGGLPILDQQQTAGSLDLSSLDPGSIEFLSQVVAQNVRATDMLRITITSFLDAYTFDLRRLMKCCTHNVLPSGHVIPFCAYNTLYRPGIVPLPELTRAIETLSQ